MKKLHVINVGHKLQRRTLYDTRRDVLLEHFIALNVPISLLNQEMI